MLFLSLLLPFLGLSGCGKDSPALLMERFSSAMQRMDFAAAYACFWQRAQIIPEERFIDSMKYVVEALGAKEILFNTQVLSMQGSTTLYELTYSYVMEEGALQNSVTLHILFENNRYYIEYQNDLILPSYSSGCTLAKTILGGNRGEIFSADGKLLAKNDYSHTVVIDVTADIDINGTIYAISEIVDLTEEDQLSLRKAYTAALEKKYARIPAAVIPKNQLSEGDRAALLAIPGVSVSDSLTEQRYYPYGYVYAHVVGYASVPSAEELAALSEQGFGNARIVGKTGIEKEYDAYLQPKSGLRVNLYAKDGSFIATLFEQASTDGKDIYLTIDSALQNKACYTLAEKLKKGQTGASIILDPKTGFVQAMVSLPSYDPNIFSFPVSEEDYQKLTSEGSSQPLFNRATSGLYPPGSIIKPFSVTPALENGIVSRYSVFPYTVTDNKWTPDGVWYWDPVTRNETPDAPLDLDTAIRFSDNIYFSWTALKMGDELFMSYMRKIRIGEKLPFDLPTSKSNLINEGSELSRKMLSDMSFGHGELLITPLQAASMYTVFQNEGDMLLPRLVWKIVERDSVGGSQVIYEAEREVYVVGAMKEETVDTLIYSLKHVVTSGTAKSIRTEGLTLAAKTGTALKGAEKTTKIAWIAAWYQGMQKDRLVVVMIEGERNQADDRHAVAKELLAYSN